MPLGTVRKVFVTCALLALCLITPALRAQVSIQLTVATGSWLDETGWQVVDVSTGIVYNCEATGGTVQTGATFSCPAGKYELRGWDTYGDGWNGTRVTITDVATGTTLVNSATMSGGGYGNTCPGPSANYAVVASFAVTVPCVTPKITTQPLTQSACSGSSVTLSVTSSMVDGTYEWRKDGVTLVTSKSNTYTINPITAASAGNYVAVLRENCDPSKTQISSSTAVITVAVVPSITTQPVPTKAICETFNDQLAVTAVGTGLTYQWRKDGVNISGATSATYAINNAQASHQGVYTCVITGTCPPAVTTNPTTVTVNIRPKAVTEPQDLFICPGSTGSITFSASGPSLIYQWYKDGFPVAGGQSATLNFTNATKSVSGLYECVATSALPNPNNCINSVRSKEVTVGIVEAPSVVTSPASTDACIGSPLNLVAEFKGSGLTYRWTRNGTVISTTNSNTLFIQNVTPGDAGNYVVTATGACNLTASTVAAVVTVIGKPQLITNPANQNVTVGGPISLSVDAKDWRTIQWYKNNMPIEGATKPIFSISSSSKDNSGYYNAVLKNDCGGVVSAIAKVTVSDPIVYSPELTVNNVSGAIGEVPFGYSSGTFVLNQVITNSGNSPLEITNVSVAPTQFEIVAAPAAAFTVEPGMSASISIKVTPTAKGSLSGLLTIQSNDPRNPTATIALTASSVVRYTHSAAENFGQVNTDNTANRCITITNTWNNDVVIDQTSITGTDASLFTLKTAAPLTIAAGASADVCIDFVPATVGNKTASLMLKSSTGGDAMIPLTGVGIPSTGIIEAVEAGITVSPNPMRDVLSIRFAKASQDVRVMVMNISGQLVTTLPVESVEAGQTFQWNGIGTNGNTLPSGMYTIVIHMGNDVTSIPVSVVR